MIGVMIRGILGVKPIAHIAGLDMMFISGARPRLL